MWSTLTFAAVLTLAPAQEGTLKLSNVRSTYGVMGARRVDQRLLPGDALVLSFEIDGLRADATGKIAYSMGTELLDSKNKIIHKQDSQNQEVLDAFGGKTLPAFAVANTGTDTMPGEYSMRVTVVDRASRAVQTFTEKFVVQPKTFGIIRVHTSYDTQGQFPASAVGVSGQHIWVAFLTIGFERDAKKTPNVAVEMRILDEAGKPTIAKPFTGDAREMVDTNVSAIPWYFPLLLTRAGKFTIELRAVDQVTKKAATAVTFPITIVEPK